MLLKMFHQIYGASPKLIFLTIVVFSLIFIADLTLPLGIASGMMYVVPVLIGSWFPRRRYIVSLAVIGSLLTLLGLFWSPSGGVLWVVLTNRGMALVAIWITAFLLCSRLSERDKSDEQIQVISNLRKAEQALKESEEQYRRIFENSGVGMTTNDLDGKYIRVNEAFCNMLGYSESELLTKSVAEVTYEEDLPMILEARQSSITEGRHFDTLEKRFVRKEGEVIWGLLNRTLVKDSDGQPLYFESQIQDITKRKILEQERLKDQERLNQASLIAGLGYFERNLIDDTVYWSDEMYRIFGVEGTRPKLTNKTFMEIVYPDDRNLVAEAVQKTLAEQKAQQTEFRILRPNGDLRHVATIREAVCDDSGQPIKIMGTLLDVTERQSDKEALKAAHDQLEERVRERTKDLNKEIEQRKKIERWLTNANKSVMAANRTKSEFLANMSHELRTPLNAIIGFSDVIKTETFGPLGNEKYVEYLNDIHQSGQHLLDLINDVLDVSAIEAGKFKLQESEILLEEAVAASLLMVKSRAEYGGVELINSVNGEALIIRADALRMKQILVNLLSNAVNFTKAGGTVTINTEIADDNSARIIVIDTGIGMDDADLAKALEKFGQAERGDLTQSGEGTGLGLPLTIGLVEAHGGKLEISSEPNKGTTVTVHIPEERVIN
jgi:PAS domain S-box-containing protein